MCDIGNAASNKQSKSSDLVVGAEKIENNTEFVILASSGIWEVCVINLKSSTNLLEYLYLSKSSGYM